jgi:TolB protein
MPRPIVFVRDRDNFESEIAILHPDGRLRNLTSTPGNDWWASVSPDGAKVAFSSARDGNYEIYVMDIDGRNQTRLTNSPEAEISPAWSPDGRRLVFVRLIGSASPQQTRSALSGNRDIFVMNADGSGVQQLTNGPEQEHSPTGSPDGARIAYVKSSFLAVMSADGSGQANLRGNPPGVPVPPGPVPPGFLDRIQVDGTISSQAPVWHPDGKRLAFICGGTGNRPDLCLLDISAERTSFLTQTEYAELPGGWSPDGSTFVFTYFPGGALNVPCRIAITQSGGTGLATVFEGPFDSSDGRFGSYWGAQFVP